MKRLEFIRRSILAAAGLAVLPAIIKEETDVVQAAIQQVKQSGYIPHQAVVTFKASNQLLLNEYLINEEIKRACKNIGEQYRLASTEIGWVNDDFVKSLYTVKLTFV